MKPMPTWMAVWATTTTEEVESGLEANGKNDEPHDGAEKLETRHEIVAPGGLEHARDENRVAIAGRRRHLQPEELLDQLVGLAVECRHRAAPSRRLPGGPPFEGRPRPCRTSSRRRSSGRRAS